MTSKSMWWNSIPGNEFAPLCGQEGLFLSTAVTPAYVFTTLAGEVGDEHIVAVTARNSFSLELGLAVFAEVRRMSSILDLSAPLTLIDGFKASGYGFDAVAVMGPQVHRRFSTNSAIHLRTFEACPVFQCEFLPGDSADVVCEVARHCVSTVDWNRAASPRVWTQYFESRLQIPKRRKRLGLTTFPSLIEFTKTMLGNDRSRLKVVNWRGASCCCDFLAHEVSIELDSSNQIAVENGEFLSWISGFVSCDGAPPFT